MTGNAPPTILHLIDTTGPGGAETVFICLVRELQKTEFRNVVVLRGEGYVADQIRALGITPYIIDSKGSFNLGYLKALRKLVKSEGVSLIHAHLLGSNVYGALLAMLCRKPMISTFHGAVDVATGERFLRAKFLIVGWGSSAIICVSKGLEKQLTERSALPSNKLKLIYNGVDPDVFKRGSETGLREELGIPLEATIVVSIGNVRPAKGYSYLVDAAIELAESDPNTHFVVVGHQRESVFKPLLQKIAASKTKPAIHWLGFREDVASILCQADLFLLPSISEGFSISTVEAMMAGIPVIATRSGGPEEIVDDGKTGILVPVKDSGAINSAIQCLKAPALRENLVIDAREHAMKKFSLSSMLQGYLDLYRQLTQR
ncbi:glycosyltransferase [Marinobacter zhejiangensis]|uniref:Glycosyltransferase involved in cell wall bisynthesis n=1 Tax=Marinobacter zhejiangensis TaxID=488535 RepID=A0A1I4RNA0_9GAMM|nr:glycosyltransferase [Marinobacter zhejiangensis]SFM53460.1 Glycosyltransferase involved in cell wall bisynthesis [Marinobacter zhejiangensis]